MQTNEQYEYFKRRFELEKLQEDMLVGKITTVIAFLAFVAWLAMGVVNKFQIPWA